MAQHSKTTCNELFKNFRIYDVIGGAYDLETRIKSNFENNRRKANKEKKRRAEEAAMQAAGEEKKQGTKRSLESNYADNESGTEDSQGSGSHKRAKVTHFFRAPLDGSSNGDSKTAQTFSVSTARSSAGLAAVKKAPLRSKKATATSSSVSTEQHSGLVAVLKVTVNPAKFPDFSGTEASDS